MGIKWPGGEWAWQEDINAMHAAACKDNLHMPADMHSNTSLSIITMETQNSL